MPITVSEAQVVIVGGGPSLLSQVLAAEVRLGLSAAVLSRIRAGVSEPGTPVAPAQRTDRRLHEPQGDTATSATVGKSAATPCASTSPINQASRHEEPLRGAEGGEVLEWMATLLGLFPGAGDGVNRQVQMAEFYDAAQSEVAQCSRAENHMGLPL